MISVMFTKKKIKGTGRGNDVNPLPKKILVMVSIMKLRS